MEFLSVIKPHLLDISGAGKDKQLTLPVSHDNSASYLIVGPCNGWRNHLSKAASSRH